MGEITIVSAATICSGLFALAGLLFKRHSVAAWSFVIGMLAFAADSALNGWSLEASDVEGIQRLQVVGFIVKSVVPGIWLCFSLTYSRGNAREFLARWRFLIAFLFVLPMALSLGFRESLFSVSRIEEPFFKWWILFGRAAQVLNISVLVTSVIIIMNLEQTFRAAVGTMRWRIKFMILGLVVIFGARIYTHTQAVLFSGYDLALMGVESGALLIGCTLMAIGYARSKTMEIDVYPSRAVLTTSLTAVFVGAYLFIVGVLAQVVARLGGAARFQAQAFLVLVGMAILAVALLSDRLRQAVRLWIARNFRKSQYDSLRLWTLFSHELATVKTRAALSGISVKLISKTFEVLSVRMWLVDGDKEQFILGATTDQDVRLMSERVAGQECFGALMHALSSRTGPFEIEGMEEDWAATLRELNPAQFEHGGCRICVPVVSGGKCLGAIVMADRVNGIPYSVEERDLLMCIGDQVSAGIVNLHLTHELVQAKEMEAFRTMSAFFVHDLKNAASGLNLMLRNLPVHFNDPEFRKDALRSVGNTVARIDQLVERLSSLRTRPNIVTVESDLNGLVSEVMSQWDANPDLVVTKDLQPLGKILADREQIQSVITNLLFNARDAVAKGGHIRVQTQQRNNRAILSIEDDGCGMAPAFVKESLFRPFQSTKKKGLGIGMFQAKMMIEAHHGSIQVESVLGKGTTFRVSFPLLP